MRYVSIDIEGTGLDVTRDQVLQIGAVVDDTSWWMPGDNFVAVNDLPTIKLNLLHDRIEGQLGGISMNAWILKAMREYVECERKQPVSASALGKLINEHGQFVKHYDAAEILRDFLIEHTYHGDVVKQRTSWCSSSLIPDVKKINITVAGKNFGTYDKPMLERLPRWTDSIICSHRGLDPTMLHWRPFDDEKLPDLATCMDRAGVLPIVTHDAVQDARDVIHSIRNYYLNQFLD